MYRKAAYIAILSYLLSIFIMVLGNIYECGFNLYYGWMYPILPCVLLYWIVRWLKNWSWLPVCLVGIIFLGEVFTLYFNHSPYSIHIVQLLFNTNRSESLDFIREALCSKPLLYTVLSFPAIGLVAWGLLKLSDFLRCYSKYPVYVLAGFSLVSAGLLLSSYISLGKRFSEKDVDYFILHRDDKPCYFTPVTRLLNGVAYAHGSSFLADKVKAQLKAAQVDDCTYDSPLIVMVIGESYNKYHTPLYNPDYRNTTPYLCALRDKDSLLVFDDVVAPFNLTNELFHALFSTCPYDCLGQWYDYTLFPAVFKKAGYKVSFLSNQFALHNDDIWNHYTGNIFYAPDMSALQYDYHNSDVYDFDGEMLQLLPDTGILKAAPHLLIIHFIGQHVSYEQRYPDSFRYYTLENTTAKYGGFNGQKITADYDNSLRYNDDVLRHIIEYVNPLDAIVIYFADHGEEVYDWRDAFMRTSEANMPPEVAKYQYEPPFVVYMTQQYISNHPQLVQSMREAVHLPIINTDFSNVLFHLAGIETPSYYPHRDFLSPQYDTTVPRILRFKEDYDTIIAAANE